jgi:hypothetical protein
MKSLIDSNHSRSLPLSNEDDPAYPEETLNQLVCWRETFTRWFVLQGKETKDAPSSKERTSIYADLDEYQQQINDFLAVLNEHQREIKSVIVFNKGKTFTKKSMRIGTESGGGWGFGWGVSVPDRIQFFYEQLEYITYRDYLARRLAAREAAQTRIKQEQLQAEFEEKERKISAERERQKELQEKAEEQRRQIKQRIDEVEHEQASIRDQIESIERNGIKKTKRSLIGSDTVYNFNSINYETLEEAEEAKKQRLEELHEHNARLEEELAQFRNSAIDL